MDAKPETSSSNKGAKQKKDVENIAHDNDCKEAMKVIVKDEDDKSSQTSSTKHENPSISKEGAEYESAKEENERLKKMLERVENDYRSLQMRFFDIFQHEPPLKSARMSPSNETQIEEEESEVSLCLGLQTPGKPNKDNNSGSSSKGKVKAQLVHEELSLGLDFKSSPTIDLSETGSDNRVEDTKEDEIGETWPPSKVLKTIKNSRKDEELPEPNSTKRARVCVRARCDTPTMNDGCQWRKYGQKIAKGNPCPRAYYRCTVAPLCPVRKQVQRFSEDMSILITTYEGTHNHPLSVAATAMASTTSAAASILLSGSSTSDSEGHSSSAPLTTTANLNGLNFTLYKNATTGQFNLPNSSSPAPPTITLDLTGPHSSHFSRRLSNSILPSSKYSSTSLDFSTSGANTFPTAWNNTYLDYSPLPTFKNPCGSFSFGKPSPQQMSYPCIERTSQAAPSSSSSSTSQQILTETLTRVLSSDPSFQSAVAAAISSMVGSNTNNTLTTMNQVNANILGSNMKWGDPIQGISISSLPQNGMAYMPTYSNKLPSSSTTSSSAAGSFMLLQPQFPFPLSKSSDLKD